MDVINLSELIESYVNFVLLQYPSVRMPSEQIPSFDPKVIT